MKKFSKLLLIFALILSISLLASCGDSKKKDNKDDDETPDTSQDNNGNGIPDWLEDENGGVEGPIVDA